LKGKAQAAEALGKIGDSTALEPLKNALTNTGLNDTFVKKHVQRALNLLVAKSRITPHKEIVIFTHSYKKPKQV
jgi:HEAT repeat protein